MQLDVIFSILILIFSVVVHEVSHGFAAHYLGDPTARLEGRLTLNPVHHLDPIGSFVVPLLLFFTSAGVMFGWAKPVPVNPYNLRGKYGEVIVAAAGPLSNLALALIFGLLVRFSPSFLPYSFMQLVATIVVINIVLAVFNLVPIPPLDGSKILFPFLPYSASSVKEFLARYSFFILLFFIIFLWQFMMPVIGFVFGLITGIGF
ncbi:MAG: site-2 protease family protein [Candidatus Taylorbacteria bacterium CG11_big_fil_rev_8_21_14_0_20_46_11]|uniref:Site-2 protease family protein n=1 Tax=Candidatus Taylorbacteria bacterium CG11_big_fil_rev_8_21_14_0_20_46_11 TaxID=1975025 RepID=A0A2H0KBN3_9BACT|nr:MAG: site-2 protease family protein [Candidatus Taylorbacteria bacterium CG11_big_fil_rev_8_21_14_0_20_46_11]